MIFKDSEVMKEGKKRIEEAAMTMNDDDDDDDVMTRTGRPRSNTPRKRKHNINIYVEDFVELDKYAKRKNQSWADVIQDVFRNGNISDVSDHNRAIEFHKENIDLRRQLEERNKRISQLEESYQQLYDKVRRYMILE